MNRILVATVIAALTIATAGCGGSSPTEPPSAQTPPPASTFQWTFTVTSSCVPSITNVLVVVDSVELVVLWPDGNTAPRTQTRSFRDGTHRVILRARRSDGVVVDAVNRDFNLMRNQTLTLSCEGGRFVVNES